MKNKFSYWLPFLSVLLFAPLAPSCAQVSGIISLVAGDGVTQYIGDGYLASVYSLAMPSGVCKDRYGNVFVADYANSRIRRVFRDTLSTYAGTGIPGYSGDNAAAVAAQMRNPSGVALDTAGNIYFTDWYSDIVRKIDHSTGVITTVCGTGTTGALGDGGLATSATLASPSGLCLDKVGNIYIADNGNNRIRKIAIATGVITTVAGSGASGFSGDGISALVARLSGPNAVCVDTAGNIYISDNGNNRIRKVDVATGFISTVVGTGTAGYAGDYGPALSSQIRNTNSIYMNKRGNLYISDFGNNVIRAVVPQGTIYTVAGSGSYGNTGNGGPALSATFRGPTGVFADDGDTLYIADGGSSVIRKVTPAFTGINEMSLNSVLSVFPNPSSGIVTLHVSAHLNNATLSVFNLLGAAIFNSSVNDADTEVDLRHCPPGVYYANVRSAEGAGTLKILINK